MTPKQWKRLFARILLFTLLGISVILLITLMLATWQLFNKERLVQKEHFNEAETLGTLEARKVTLKQNLQKLDTERGLEEEVRKRFPVAKPGEVEIMFIPAKSEKTSSSTEERGFFERLFGWFSR